MNESPPIRLSIFHPEKASNAETNVALLGDLLQQQILKNYPDSWMTEQKFPGNLIDPFPATPIAPLFIVFFGVAATEREGNQPVNGIVFSGKANFELLHF